MSSSNGSALYVIVFFIVIPACLLGIAHVLWYLLGNLALWCYHGFTMPPNGGVGQLPWWLSIVLCVYYYYGIAFRWRQ